ncbi:NusG domain II-containing protein [Paenibacillus lutimineralis]|uniref:NusG domain II-containing protein n=1 Tax=Paenibacillus lutimineralis TaxID=2707005 RepID=A0A3Q9IBP1_9BACL|nr:NusG domain II-containing protein [Paenibacillus lutimineralis]AZS15499.1 NusG domain II-containing protein [Paenibacillus lutimineralis]
MSDKFKKGDIVLIVSIFLLAMSLLGVRSLQDRNQDRIRGNPIATINVDGKVHKTVELTKETQYVEIRTERGYDILKIHDKGIEVVESDCPEKICFTFGLIKNPSEVIICIPMRMIVEVNGEPAPSDNEIDAVVS